MKPRTIFIPRAIPAHARGFRAGFCKVSKSGGAENMSRVPFLFRPVFFGQAKV